VLMANKRSYRTNEGLSQVQETARSAFELIARDVRQSGTTGCDNARKMTDVLSNSGTNWWEAWESIHGFDNTEADSAVGFGTSTNNRVSGTDSLRLRGIDGTGFPIETHSAASGTFTLQTAYSTVSSLTPNDYLIVCDFDHSVMLKGGAWDSTGRVMSYSTGTGNCGTGLGYPSTCATPISYTFQKNAWIGRLAASDWYIGYNSRGGKSLFRLRLANGGAAPAAEEIVAGVTDMQITYGVNGSDNIVAANAATSTPDWTKVNSVFITLTIDSTDTNISTDAATNSGKLTRNYTYIITLRNRVT
jgi:type IV pilus assembly protein PilW